MAVLNFPTSPVLNEVYSASSRSWKWNGSSWIPTSSIGPQGVIGITGPQGIQGIQGPAGTVTYPAAGLAVSTGTAWTTSNLYWDNTNNIMGIALTPVANNGVLQVAGHASFRALLEKATVSATAATGTINFDAVTQAVVYYTSNASANWTLNLRGSSSLTLNNMMQTGQSLTLAFMATNGATAYYQSALTVDGIAITPKWQGGTAPTGGNASGIDAYVLTVIKTGTATFTVLASQTEFA